MFLRQSTAFTFRIGPFLDSTDGVTAETGLTIAQADIQISKAGGAFAQTSASPTTTHDADGWYQCPLTATDTNTLGRLTVQVVSAGALPVWEHFTVLPAMVYDSLIAGSDSLEVDAVAISGDATAADNLEAAADGTGFNLGGGSIVAASVTGAVGSVTGSVASVSGNVDGSVASVVGAVGSVTGNVGGNVVGSVASVTGNVGGSVANVTGGINTAAGTITTLDGLDTEQDSQHASTRSDIAAVDTVVDAILVDTAEIGTAGAGLTEAGGTGDQLTAVPWNTAWDAEVQSEVADALNAYDPPTAAELTAGLNALNDLSAAEVNAQVLDVMNTDNFSQPASVPGASATLANSIRFIAAIHSNELQQTSTTLTVRNAADNADLYTASVSDDGTTATRGGLS